jgi:hypothetical protein
VVRERAARELRVVFDTNALHTQMPGDLVNNATREIIVQNSNYPDLQVKWYLPSVVRLERHYQMRGKAEQWLVNFQKMDSILGYGISLKPEQIPAKIDAAIEQQMRNLKLAVLPLDAKRVDWERVMHDSALRHPPFQVGETEKGFRDAMIVEAFLQLVEDSPRNASSCRIALISGDELVGLAVEARIQHVANAEVLSSLEELRNLINTLVSTVDEATVRDLREKARKLFFIPKDETTVWARKKLLEQIREKFGEELAATPEGATGRDLGQVSISPPRFVKKEGQRVHWITAVKWQSTAYKFDMKFDTTNSGLAGLGIAASVPIYKMSDMFSTQPVRMISPVPTYISTSSGGGLMGFNTEKVVVKKGLTEIDVAWSATLDTKMKLKGAKIDSIEMVGTSWE